MPLITLSFKHGQTLDDAKLRLHQTVTEARSRFGALIHSAAFTTDQTAVTLTGPGLRIDLRVDATSVHLSGDIPLLASLLGGRFATSLKQLVQDRFTRQLPNDPKSTEPHR